MPIDYSKWDKLEISDDEDFECHPNVDKASFIRWKQADIHQKREERRQRIEGLTDELEQIGIALKRIDEMTQQLQTEGIDSFLKTIERLREASEKMKAEREQQKKADAESEIPPDNFPQPIPPTFDEVMTALFEKIQKEIQDESKESAADALIAKLKIQREKYSQRQVEAKGELEKEQAEAKKKITMDDIHTGFDKSSVSKITKLEPPKPKPKHKKTEKVLEVLNPNTELKPLSNPPKDGDDDDDGDGDGDDDDEEMIISQTSKEFAKIKDYHASYKFISEHPEIVDQEVVDQILAEAFQAELKHKSKYAKQCVHQAWLLQYCQKLGKDGVSLFFQRITSPQAKEQAREIFNTDVEETYKRITERCKVIGEERKQKQSEQPKQVEQIQIEVTDPGSNVRIRIPDAKSTDPEEQTKWEVYQTLPQDLRDAFETGELSHINKVLGKMTVEEAEKMLELTGKAGVLSIEEGIIDTTKGETIADREKKAQQNVEMETDA